MSWKEPAVNIADAFELKIAKTRADLPHARHLPGNIYSSQEIYDLEMKEYFGRDWLLVGREEQFAKPGDFEARRIVGRPIIIARDKNGTLGAFYNMCVHRGVEVATGCGNAKHFKCPYHGWTYDLSGQLAGASYMKDTPDFKASETRLQKIHLEVWRGNVFISFADSPPPFEQAIFEFEKDFAILHTEKCRLADVTRVNLKCNWKFFHENLMDFYHVNVLHVKSFGAHFSWTPDNVQLKDNGGLTIRYNAAPSTPEGKTLFAKMPWLADKESNFAITGLLPPNLTLFGRIDGVKLMVAWPLGPNECEVWIYMLFPEEFHSDPDFQSKIDVYRSYQGVIYEEDRGMIESMQIAMASPLYVPGRMSVMEKPIHHFLSSYIDRMFGPGN